MADLRTDRVLDELITHTDINLIAAEVNKRLTKPAATAVESAPTVKPDGTVGSVATVDETTLVLKPAAAPPAGDAVVVRAGTDGTPKWVQTSTFGAGGTGGTAGPAGAGALVWTTEKNTAYAAVAGDAVPVNAKTGPGSFAVTLPAGVNGQADIRVRRVDDGWTSSRLVEVRAPDGTTVLASLQAGSDVVFSWVGGTYVLRERPRPFNLVTPPMKNQDDVMPIGMGRSVPALRRPERTMVKRFYSVADATFSTSGAGATIAQDPDPYHSSGTPMMNITTTSNSYTQARFTYTLPYAVDATDQIVGIISRFTRLSSGVRGISIKLSSDNFATSNCHRVGLSEKMMNKGAWMQHGGSVATAGIEGTGADLTKINAIRFYMESNSPGLFNFSWSIAEVWVGPNVATKAKAVIWLDDARGDHFSSVFPYLERYGFPATLAYVPGQDDSMPPEQARRLQAAGWQVGSHSFSIPEHSPTVENGGQLTQDQFRQGMAKNEHAMRTFGFTGYQDWAWYGGLDATTINLRSAAQFFRTGRFALSGGSAQGEVMPPIEPMFMSSALAGVNDGSLIGYAQKAVTQRGLAQFVFHGLGIGTDGSPTDTGFRALVEWLDANRDVIDVVTLEEALQPHLVSSPRLNRAWGKPPAPAAPAVAPGVAQVTVTVPAVSTVGTAPVVAVQVYRGTAAAGPFTALGVTRTGQVYVDTTAVAGTTYYYTAVARNVAGDSAQSPASVGVSPT